MEIVRSQRQVAAAASGGGGGGAGALPTYKAAPQLEVRLEEFELFAIDRLRGAAFSWLEKCTQPGFLSLLPAL